MKRFTNKSAALWLLLVFAAPGFCASGVPPVQSLAPADKQLAEPAQTAPAKKQTLTAAAVTEGLTLWDKKLHFLDTSFDQTTTYDGVLISRSNGKLYYDGTNNFLRLDTLDADDKVQQSAVTDKKIIVMLDEKGKQITELSWKDWQEGQPNKALFDFGNYTALIAQHNTALFEETPEYVVLELSPKKGGEYRLYLSLSKADFFPQVITIVSDLMRTEAQLADTVKNKKIRTDLFKGVTKK